MKKDSEYVFSQLHWQLAHSQDVDHPQIQEAQAAQHQRRAVPQTAQQMEAYLRSVVLDLQQVQQQFMVPQL